MPSRAEHSDLTAAELADLSALADGTLDPARRAAVEAHISSSPELSTLYAREQRVVAALQQARETERAPAALRARIEASRPAKRTVARRRIGYAAGLVGALAAIALALVLALPSGAPGGPSVSEAAALAARGATQPAPSPDPAHPQARLSTNVDDVYFPNWASSLRWRAVGARADTLDGRQAVTVYYEWKGKRVAYTIVAAPPLTQPAAHRSWRHGTELHTFTQNGRLVVTWREGGDTCILSGTGISADGLQKLAAWSVPADAH